jgi:SEFIR domain-containing protein
VPSAAALEGSPLLKGSTERTAFISYSWTTEEHRKWVLELAKRLRSHGVDVILDVWHLKLGHDKYAFMERMVTDPVVKKVIIICDRRYQEKADNREGGVGDETLLITPEVYGKVDQEKFIPIVVERDESGNPYMPAYLISRMYIDMSVAAQFDEKYQELLRALYDKPDTTPPPLGTPPAYILGEVTGPAGLPMLSRLPQRGR